MSGTHIKGGLTVGGVEVISSAGAITADIQATAGSISRTELSTAAASRSASVTGSTIATTSTTTEYVVASASGSITAATITPLVALATSDTNYITWTITNLGQANAGTAVILAATSANTTKVTGGSALAINTPRSLTLTSTAADLVVVEGDVLQIVATATGTLANTVTRPVYRLTILGTT